MIVVVDGPDEATRRSLADIVDDRMRVVPLDVNIGLASVRNLGVANARGQWVAFLDDDDEWFEGKIEAQVREAERLGGERVLIFCHYIERNLTFERVLPYRSPKPNEEMSEYLFCRKGIFSESGLLQPSTYFASRKLLQEVQFKPRLRPHEDFDWLMRASRSLDRPFVVLDSALSVYHNEASSGREGNSGEFDFYWNYAHANRTLFTPAAFSFYLGTFCAPTVNRSGHSWALLLKIFRGMYSGKLTLRCFGITLGYAFCPLERRMRLRKWIATVVGGGPIAPF